MGVSKGEEGKGGELTPFVVSAYLGGGVELGDFVAELVEEFAEVEGFGGLVGGGFVDGHVEDAKVELAEVEEGVVDVFGLDEVGDELVRELGFGVGCVLAGLVAPGGVVLGRQGRVVRAQGFELGRGPAPVLEHLRGGFDEVADDVCAVEAGVVRFGDEVVDAVAEFVEEGGDLFVLEEAGLLGCRLGEVAYESCDGVVARAVCVDEAGLNVKVCRVAVFAFTGVEVQVEVADEAAALVFGVPDAEDLAVGVPDDIVAFAGRRDGGAVIARYFDKGHAEQGLENGQHPTD